MAYKITVLVKYKPEVVEPIGKSTMHTITNMGYHFFKDIKAGKVFDLVHNGTDPEKVHSDVENICKKLLVNPLIEDYEIKSIDEIVEKVQE